MKRGRAMAAGGVAALALVAGLVTWFTGPAGGRPRAAILLQPDDTRVLALGQQIYATRCAACHGERLEGQSEWRRRGPDGLLPAPPHDASGHTWHHDDATLFAITKLGVAQVAGMPDYRTAMPVYEGVLSDAEIVAVLSWIKAQWPPRERALHDEINQRAAVNR